MDKYPGKDLCILNHDLKIGNIRIPKNCSSALRTSNWLKGWPKARISEFDEKIIEDYNFFVVIRNPLERFVSGYIQALGAKAPEITRDINSKYELEEILQKFLQGEIDDPHLIPQTDFIENSKIKKVKNLHYFLLEKLQQQADDFAEKNGIIKLEIEKIRITKKEKKEKYLRLIQEKSISNLIKEIYKKDFELYWDLEKKPYL